MRNKRELCCVSQGREEAKLQPTKCTKQTRETNATRVARSCLRTWGGRAKVLPSTTSFVKFRGLSLALCMGWKLHQSDVSHLPLAKGVDVREKGK